MKKLAFYAILGLGLGTLCATAQKKPLDHDAFDNWKSVKVHSLSDSGEWAAYSVNPQEGDGTLIIRNTKTGKEIPIPRGYLPAFTANSQWAAALIKPLYADTRAGKIAKKKDFDLPQDSLAVINLRTGKVEKIASVNSYKIGRKGGDWIAYLSADTALIKPKHLKDKESGQPLVVRKLDGSVSKQLNWVKEYVLSNDGLHLAAEVKPHKSDSTAVASMVMLNLPDTTTHTLLTDMKFYGRPVFSYNSDKLAFTATTDSTESGTKRAKLYYGSTLSSDPEVEEQYVIETVNAGKYPTLRPPVIRDESQRDSIMKAMHEQVAALAGDSLFVNQYSKPRFSRDGKRLIIGVARPVAADDTTIVDFEQASLDIWRWDAPLTPPQEKENLKSLRERTYPVVIDLTTGKEQLVTSTDFVKVEESDLWNGDWVLLHDMSNDIVEQQWNYSAPEQLRIFNVNTGESRDVAKVAIDCSNISPKGKYVYWFADRNYYTYNIATGETVNVSEALGYPLWDEDSNVPMAAAPYGDAGWTDNDAALIVYDRHDIWQLDPSGKSAPINLTKGDGRAKNLKYRYRRTNDEERSLTPGSDLLLTVFSYDTKENGFATLKLGTPAAPTVKVLDKYSFTQLQKARNAQVYAFQKANFSTSPDVYIATSTDFAKAKKVTDANPQMSEYSWGTAQLEKWYAYNGDLTEGVLYVPEGLDTSKKYPMLVVFYETNSEELYRHYTMEPSWSWVNYPFYVSRGYVVFVPDVHYFAGLPGESAYNYICSGVEDLCKRYPWIDKDHIGIDGQSWGGYQTAFLVTRTNMFACAGSGAPVSNMTSAYGGIRWGSGDSRQAQYENGQSRIGRNLWDAPELYIANSPIFHADRVQTPLLIMHNDADGAVPWYQGIEYFMALRRLQKPVWMLQYNGEAHNIKARKNRKDITRRLQEFFDYYLKDGSQMPRWMQEGINPLRKGQDMGFDN